MIKNDNELTENKRWKRHYDLLIEKAKNTNYGDSYTEQHHIVPKCLGGSNSKNNIVRLSAREHYVAHQLLAKIYPQHPGLISACIIMCTDKDGNRINNKTYSWLRTKLAETMRNLRLGKTKENCESTARGAAKKRGRTKQTHQYIANMANAKRGITKKENPKLSNGGLSTAKKIKGQTKETLDSIKRMSETQVKRMSDPEIKLMYKQACSILSNDDKIEILHFRIAKKPIKWIKTYLKEYRNVECSEVTISRFISRFRKGIDSLNILA